MIIFKLAWRNLWRNSKRSWISIFAISTAFLILMIMSGIMAGISVQMLKNGTELFQGHIQIHHLDYLPGRNMYDWIGQMEPYDLDDLQEKTVLVEGVQASASRVYGFGLISTGENTTAANLSGMDPVREPSVTRLLQSSIEGETISADPQRKILIGKILAKTLEVSPGDEVAIVTQSADGTTGNDLYIVSGLISTGLTSMDRSLVIMHWRDLQELLAMEEWQVHEVALLVDDPQKSSFISDSLNSLQVLPPDTLAESWEDLLPMLKEYIKVARSSGWIMILFVGIFAGFGTLNTMMMSVFERTREIGTVNALGMSPYQILSMFLLESFFLSVLGLGIGFTGGLLIISYLTRNGLDLSAWMVDMSFAGSHIDPVMQVVWTWNEFKNIAISLTVIVLLATLLPAVRAARMKPVDALAKG
jgi:putative ABC transport system permease protein